MSKRYNQSNKKIQSTTKSTRGSNCLLNNHNESSSSMSMYCDQKSGPSPSLTTLSPMKSSLGLNSGPGLRTSSSSGSSGSNGNMVYNCLDFTGTGMLQNGGGPVLQQQSGRNSAFFHNQQSNPNVNINSNSNLIINDFFNTARLNQIQNHCSGGPSGVPSNQIPFSGPVNRISSTSTLPSQHYRMMMLNQSQPQPQPQPVNQTTYNSFHNSSTISAPSGVRLPLPSSSSNNNPNHHHQLRQLKQVNIIRNNNGNNGMMIQHQGPQQRHLLTGVSPPPPGLGYSASGCFNPIIDYYNAVNGSGSGTSGSSGSSGGPGINGFKDQTSPDVCNLNFGYRYNNISFPGPGSTGSTGSTFHNIQPIGSNYGVPNNNHRNSQHQHQQNPNITSNAVQLNPNANDFVPSFSSGNGNGPSPIPFGTKLSSQMQIQQQHPGFGNNSPSIFGNWNNNPNSMLFNEMITPSVGANNNTSINHFGSSSKSTLNDRSTANAQPIQPNQLCSSWNTPGTQQLFNSAWSFPDFPPTTTSSGEMFQRKSTESSIVKPFQPPPISINVQPPTSSSTTLINQNKVHPSFSPIKSVFNQIGMVDSTEINSNNQQHYLPIIEKPRRSSSFTNNPKEYDGFGNHQELIPFYDISNNKSSSVLQVIPSPIKTNGGKSRLVNKIDKVVEENKEPNNIEFDQEDIFNISFWCNAFLDNQHNSSVRKGECFDLGSHLKDDDELTVEEIIDDQLLPPPDGITNLVQAESVNNNKNNSDSSNDNLIPAESSDDSSNMFNTSFVTVIERSTNHDSEPSSVHMNDNLNDEGHHIDERHHIVIEDIIDLDKLRPQPLSTSNLSINRSFESLEQQPPLVNQTSSSSPGSSSSNNSTFMLHNNTITNNSVNAFNANASRFKDRLYKTEFCRNLNEFGRCKFADECRFAHSEAELRNAVRIRQVKYKTVPCCEFEKGICYYGARCWFIHQKPEPAAWLTQLEHLFADQFFDPNFESITGPMLERVYQLVSE